MTSEPVRKTIKVIELFAISDKAETSASISRKCVSPVITYFDLVLVHQKVVQKWVNWRLLTHWFVRFQYLNT